MHPRRNQYAHVARTTATLRHNPPSHKAGFASRGGTCRNRPTCAWSNLCCLCRPRTHRYPYFGPSPPCARPECQPEIRFLPESGLNEATQLPQNGGEYFLWPTTWARGGNARELHTDQIRNRHLVSIFERLQALMAGVTNKIVSVRRHGEGRVHPS